MAFLKVTHSGARVWGSFGVALGHNLAYYTELMTAFLGIDFGYAQGSLETNFDQNVVHYLL